MKRTLIISNIIMILFLIFTGIAFAGSATLSWTANSDTDLAGYKIYYGTSHGGPYGSSSALIPKTQTSYTISDLSSGTYYFIVIAVDTALNESIGSEEASKTISATIEPATAVTLTPNVSSPQTPGTTVTFTAQASGGSGTYEYQFYIKLPNGRWSLAQDYSSANIFAWDTTSALGRNEIWVRTRSAGSPVSYDLIKGVIYFIGETIAPVTAITLTPNVSSPQTPGTTVTFTAQASGGSGTYEYQFYIKLPNGRWSLAQDYSSANIFAWDTTSALGRNEIWVRTRSAGSPVSYDLIKGVIYFIGETIAPVTAITLTPNVSSPQTPGTTVTFTAQASGGSGTYEYQFYIKLPNGTWSLAQDYSSANIFTWDTTSALGRNEIWVRTRSAGSPVSYDLIKGVVYVVK